MTVVPETVHTLAVSDENDTVKPDDADAETVFVPLLNNASDSDPKVIV